MKTLVTFVGVVILAVGNLGCLTTRTITDVVVNPVQTSYPVSASPSFVDGQGTIVNPDGYTMITSFHLDKVVMGEVNRPTTHELTLAAEVGRMIASSQGDAATNVVIRGVSYDSGGHTSVPLWKFIGWFSLGIGGPISLMAAETELKSGSPSPIWLGSTALAAFGVFSFIYAYYQGSHNPPRWNIVVDGQIVKRNAASLGQAAPRPFVDAPNSASEANLTGP